MKSEMSKVVVESALLVLGIYSFVIGCMLWDANMVAAIGAFIFGGLDAGYGIWKLSPMLRKHSEDE